MSHFTLPCVAAAQKISGTGLEWRDGEQHGEHCLPPWRLVMNGSWRTGLHAVALVALAACVDGDGLIGVGIPRPVTIAAVPRFAVPPSSAVVAALDRVRITLTSTADDSVLIAQEAAIDPSAEEWAFEITIELPSDKVLELRLDIELIDADPVIEVVEYAGRTEFEVRASFEPQEIREINLGRGPLENLALTALTVSGARTEMQEGASDFLDVDTLGSAPGQILYFESSDPAVASVDSLGNIEALTPGTSDITVTGGRQADTLHLMVGRVNLPSSAALEATVSPQVSYVADVFFTGTFSEPGAAVELSDAIEDLLQEMLAGRGFEAVGRFEEDEAEWEEYGAGTNLQFLDGPQLGVFAITLMHAADALGIKFPRNSS